MISLHNVACLTALVVAACGGAQVPDDGARDAIAPALAGTWVGAMEVSTPGQRGMRDATISIALESDTRAAISGLCPGSDATLRVVGSGTRLAWADTFSCPTSILAGCETAVAVLTDVKVSLFAGTSINIEAGGTVTGCGTTEPLHLMFDGTR